MLIKSDSTERSIHKVSAINKREYSLASFSRKHEEYHLGVRWGRKRRSNGWKLGKASELKSRGKFLVTEKSPEISPCPRPGVYSRRPETGRSFNSPWKSGYTRGVSARKIETSRGRIKHSPRCGRFIAETSGIRGADLLRRRIYYDGGRGMWRRVEGSSTIPSTLCAPLKRNCVWMICGQNEKKRRNVNGREKLLQFH